MVFQRVHLLLRTILHFSSIAFLIVGQLTSLGNILSVCSLTADSRFGSYWWSFSPLPSTLPSFASSRRNTNSNNLRAKSLGLLLERRSTFFLERYILLLVEPTSIVTSELSTFLSVLFWMEITFSFFWARGVEEETDVGIGVEAGWVARYSSVFFRLVARSWRLTSLSSRDL